MWGWQASWLPPGRLWEAIFSMQDGVAPFIRGAVFRKTLEKRGNNQTCAPTALAAASPGVAALLPEYRKERC